MPDGSGVRRQGGRLGTKGQGSCHHVPGWNPKETENSLKPDLLGSSSFLNLIKKFIFSLFWNIVD